MGAGPHTQPLTQPGISCPSSPLCSIPDTDFLRRCVGPFAFFHFVPCLPQALHTIHLPLFYPTPQSAMLYLMPHHLQHR
jgi:hypothetical protein